MWEVSAVVIQDIEKIILRPRRVTRIDIRLQVYTCGKIPYGRAGNAEVVDHVQRGQRLEKPRVCPRNVYSIMKACWEK